MHKFLHFYLFIFLGVYTLPKISYIILLSDVCQGVVIFSNCWSVKGLRKIIFGKEILNLSGKT